MTTLKNRTAIVTGGGTGIGRAVAIALAGDGASVVICGRRKKPLQKVVGEIEAAGGKALAVQADVAHEDDVQRVVDAAVEAFGPVAIAVNNAGIGGTGSIHRHSIETWDRVMAVNLRGPFLMARAVLPMMREQQRGHIINVSSESGVEYYPRNGAYGVSKHALNALGEFIQRENQEQGIRVNTICPGMVITEMTADAPGLDPTKSLQPEEIADLITWLVTRQPNLKIGLPLLIQTMQNPWK